MNGVLLNFDPGKCINVSSTTVFNIDDNENVSWAPNQYIRMISKGSCDTEYWSNDTENSALSSKEQFTFIQLKLLLYNCNISQYYCFIVFLIK